MNNRVLFVDDEGHVLHSFQRNLRKTFSVATASSAKEGLKRIAEEGPFAVVVSDLLMPGVDGISFLKQVKELAPDSVRIMLSGKADLNAAIDAVNDGQVFKFLTKPCEIETLVKTISTAVRQYQLVTSEKELLNHTLKGSIRMMSELLSFARPNAYSQAVSIRRIAVQIADYLKLPSPWQYEVAALLCQVGCVAVPEAILHKIQGGVALTDEEKRMYRNHPKVGASLVRRISRLENVASMIEMQLEDYGDLVERNEYARNIVLGSSIIRVCQDYDHLILRGRSNEEARKELQAYPDKYGPEIVESLSNIKKVYKTGVEKVFMTFDELVPGMVTAQDVKLEDGTVIIAGNQKVTLPIILCLQSYIDHIGIQEPIVVWKDSD